MKLVQKLGSSIGIAAALVGVGCSSSSDLSSPNGDDEYSSDVVYVQGPEGPSCAGLDKLCGIAGEKSCCSSLFVPGGTFPMGRGNGKDACPGELSCGDDDRPEHEVMVSDFYLDEFEVTVGRFRKYLDAYEKPSEGAGAHPKIPGSGWKKEWDNHLPPSHLEFKDRLERGSGDNTWRGMAEDTEQHPINRVSWYEAFAFCIWDGGRLPTEAEWEKAAVGGVQNRLYPWGSKKPDKTRANYDELYDSTATNNASFEDIAKVGMLPAGQGRWGHKDLAGNLFEWVLDRYDVDWYGGEGKTCVDCANVSEISERVIRGGSYNFGARALRAAYRFMPVYAHFRGNFTGFRCARDR